MGWKQWMANAAVREVAALALGLAVAVTGMVVSVPAQAQIRSTKHNLGTSPGGTGVNQFSGPTALSIDSAGTMVNSRA